MQGFSRSAPFTAGRGATGGATKNDRQNVCSIASGMTSEGSSYSRFRRTIERGNLIEAESALCDRGKSVTRIRVPQGLDVEAGDYHVETLDGRCIATRESGGRVDLASVWDELRVTVGVEIECPRHPDRWWATAGRDLPAAELRTWRCPMCVWAFREGLKGSGGTPRF